MSAGDRIRIQFPISLADQLQLVKMVETAMEKVSRSFPNYEFPEVAVRQSYPIIETTYPVYEISAYDQIKLEVYLHLHVADSKFSYLYMTAMCLEADLFFPAAVHGLNIPPDVTTLDQTRSFLPFETVNGLLKLPTLDKTSPNTLLSSTTLAMRFDSLSYATVPFHNYKQVTVQKGILSFNPVTVSYDDTIILSLSDLNIDKDSLDLKKADFDWEGPNVFRSVTAPPPAGPAIQNPPNDDASVTPAKTKSTNASAANPSKQSVAKTKPTNVMEILGAAPVYPRVNLINQTTGRVEIPSFPPRAPRLFSNPYAHLTAKQRLARKDGLQYPREYIPERLFSPHLGDLYHKNAVQDVRIQLARQNDYSRSNSGIFSTNFSDVVPLASSDNYPITLSRKVVSDDIFERESTPKPQISIDDQIDALTKNAVEVSGETVFTDCAPIESGTSTPSNVSLDNTVIPVTPSGSVLVPPVTRRAKSEQDAAYQALIFQYERIPSEIGLSRVNPDEMVTIESLYILSDDLLEFGIVLTVFMNLPENREHWYFVDGLRPLFHQLVDDQWQFSLVNNNSATFLPLQRLDSAHTVIYDKNLTDPKLASTAKSFQDYMAQATS